MHRMSTMLILSTNAAGYLLLLALALLMALLLKEAPDTCDRTWVPLLLLLARAPALGASPSVEVHPIAA